jgi:hypothetical protein
MKASSVDRPLLSTRHLAHLLGVRREELREMAQHAQSLYSPFTMFRFKNGGIKARPMGPAPMERRFSRII